MPDLLISCPACQRPLAVPESAIGKRGRCSHCDMAFDLPRLKDGSAGTPVLRRAIPRTLVIPAIGMVLLGVSGLMVNGYLAFFFVNQPGAELNYAKTQLIQLRSMRELSQGSKPDQNWEHGPRAAVSGVAPAAYTARIAEELADEPIAQLWAESMLPLQLTFLAVSFVVFLGGVLIVRGRFYYLALLTCVVAMLNFNHLCCVPGFIVGLWGILMLARDDVRTHFR